jgi:signal transduction histidine kinase
MMNRSLGARLFIGALCFLGIALFLTWFALSRLFETYVNESYYRELQAVADTIAADIRNGDDGLTLLREPADPRFQIPAGGRYWQVAGLVSGLQRSRSLWDQELKTKSVLSRSPQLFLAEGPSGGDLVVLNTAVSFEKDGTARKADISIAADRSEYEAASAEFRSELFLMLGLTGLFLALASALQIYVGLRPLVNVRQAVAAVRQGLSPHIDDSGPEEVRPLITEINTLLAGERGAVERARARASDLAHGLKTPLTVLAQIGETLEMSGDPERARRIHEQVSTIRDRTDRQLALARTGGRGASKLDAASLAAKILRVVEHTAASKNVTIENRIPQDCGIYADATDFAEAIGNLVDNAIIHAHSKVAVIGAKRPGSIRITVADDGAGIDAKDRALALERGQRLDESGNGSGLGLAITADIMRAYGGSISLDNSSMGGLAVHLDWPSD